MSLKGPLQTFFYIKDMENEEGFSVDQLSDILPIVDDNMDSWVNHAAWYDLECINHYDQQPTINCVVQDTNITSLPQISGISSIVSGAASASKTMGVAGGISTETACTTDILSGLQTILKGGNMYGADPSVANQIRTAVSVSHSGIMNGIFIPSNLIQQNISPKDYENPTSVALSPINFESNSPLPQSEEELVEFLRTDRGREIMAKALDLSVEDLHKLLNREPEEMSVPSVDYHCCSCQCLNENSKASMPVKETSLAVPQNDLMPRSPELMKATSPDSSTALSDHLSPSPFDTNLAASPEIPIIKREFVDDVDRNDCPTVDTSPVNSNEKTRRHRGTYPKSLCLDVIEFVKQGFSARAAAKKFGIPKSTVHNWLHEDIATRPEKGHRKRAQPSNHPDAPKLKAKPDLNDYIVSSNDISSNSVSITYERGKIPFRGSYQSRTSESLSSEDMDTKTDFMTDRASPVHPPSRDKCSSSSSQEASKTHLNAEIKTEGEDLSCDLDELLHIEDWIEQEEWYGQQYMKHYGTPSRLRKTYGSYSNTQRKAAIDFVRNGNSISTAARKFGIPKSTIHTWLTEEGGPQPLNPDIENEILDKMDQVQGRNGQCFLKLGTVKKVAQEVANSQLPNFRATYSWCRDFVKRHDIYLNDSKESIDRLCEEDQSNSRPPSMVDFTSFLGLKPATESRGETVYSTAT